jgi:DNA-binding CsgD family transcriptional regulator
LPLGIGAAAETVVAARGRPERMARIFDRSPVPMVMVDSERRYVEANRPARLVLRLTLDQLRSLALGDLTPPSQAAGLDELWSRLLETGFAAGPHGVALPDGGRFDAVFYGLADARPDLHVLAFAPARWSDEELGLIGANEPRTLRALTPRELEVLELAAEGHIGPQIAERLLITPATVKTHFEHIYSKLGVADRAGAVARAMRLGLIA